MRTAATSARRRSTRQSGRTRTGKRLSSAPARFEIVSPTTKARNTNGATGRTEPRQLPAASGACSAREPPSATDAGRPRRPTSRSRSPDHEEHEPDLHAELVDDHAEQQRFLAGTLRRNVPLRGSSCAVQVAGDDLLGRSGEDLRHEQLEHEHDDDVDGDVGERKRWVSPGCRARPRSARAGPSTARAPRRSRSRYQSARAEPAASRSSARRDTGAGEAGADEVDTVNADRRGRIGRSAASTAPAHGEDRCIVAGRP